MADLKKVIKGLECCQHLSKSYCDECPYNYEGLCYTNDCISDLTSDALDQLKEQKAKLVLNIADSIAGMEVGDCPGCGRHLVNKISDPSKFCKYCGQAVKWE